MRKLLTVTLFSGLLTLARMLSGFFIAKVVAVYTGPSGIAMLGQVQSLFSALNGIVAAPAGSGVVRYTAEYQASGFDHCAPWWKAALRWVLLLMAVVIPLSCILAQLLAYWVFGNVSYYWLVVVTALALPLSVANTLVASVINGQHQYRRYVVLGMLSVVIATVVMVILVVQKQLNGALLAAALFTGISGLVMLLGVMRQPWFRLKYWWGKTDRTQMKGIAGYVAMAITSAITLPIALVLVRNILIAQVGWETAGHWQAVWKISEVYLGVIGVALSTYFLPKLTSLKGVDAIRQEIHSTVKIVMPIVLLLAIMVYLLRDVAIQLIFTEAFQPARDFFAIQLIGDVIKVLSLLYAYPMLSRGATKWFIATEILFAINFVVFTYLLVPLYGVHGANLAYLINYSIYLFFIYKNLKNFVH